MSEGQNAPVSKLFVVCPCFEAAIVLASARQCSTVFLFCLFVCLSVSFFDLLVCLDRKVTQLKAHTPGAKSLVVPFVLTETRVEIRRAALPIEMKVRWLPSQQLTYIASWKRPWQERTEERGSAQHEKKEQDLSERARQQAKQPKIQ